LPACGKLQSRSSKHQNSKEKAWGGREEDGKLTQANKKGANPPVSFDGL
jgi:hypothetical protein